MILTVNIGNTHITVGGYEQDTLRFCGRLHSDTAATVDEYAIRLVNLLSLHGASPAQIEGGILGTVVPVLSGRVLSALRILCNARILTVGRPEKRHQASAGQPRPAGCRAFMRCCCCTGRVFRAAGGDLSRHRYLHDGSQCQAGACGRRDPARATALAERTGAEYCPAAADRPCCKGSCIHSGQEHLFLLAERLCAGHRQPAGRSGGTFLRRAWPADSILRHRQSAHSHPGSMLHPHSIPGDPHHRRAVPHLDEKQKRITRILPAH
jgi:hypothetical protein